MQQTIIAQTDWNQILAIAQIVMAFGTLVLAIAAVFGGSISRIIRRPILKVNVNAHPPDCQKIPLRNRETGAYISDSYYFRIWVENVGRTSAKNVEVFAKQLQKRQEDGKYKTVQLFFPMNLGWSHMGGMLLFPAIHRGAGKHCDVSHIVDPSKRDADPIEQDHRVDIPSDKAILSFDTIVKANTKRYLQPPGEYRLKIIVAAENTKAYSKTLRIMTDGEWIDDEERMLDYGVKFEAI